MWCKFLSYISAHEQIQILFGPVNADISRLYRLSVIGYWLNLTDMLSLVCSDSESACIYKYKWRLFIALDVALAPHSLGLGSGIFT